MNKTTFQKYIHLTRVNKPAGSLLILWPVLWALWVAGDGAPSILVSIVFIVGTFLMHAAISVIDDIFDQKFDGKVERTKNRPLITGEVTEKEAWIVFAGLIGCAFLLVLLLNWFAILLSCGAIILGVIYPLMKRYTHWPQLFLGLSTAWAVPMVFAAQTNSLPPMTWLVFSVALIFPVIYDTIYAMADRPDDRIAGIKSTAVLFADNVQLFLMIMQLLLLALLTVLGVFNGLDAIYFVCLIIAGILFYYQHRLIQKNTMEHYLKAYRNNVWVGGIIFFGMVVGFLIL